MRRALTRMAFVGLIVLSACTDNQPNSGLPSEPSVGGPQTVPAPGTCTSLTTLKNLAKTVFASGNPNANSVIGKLDNLDKDIKKGKLADAQQKAIDIVAFILKKKGSFQPQSTLLDFINKILCYAGLPAGLSDLGGISVVTASETQTTETYRDDQQAGLVIPPGAFNAPAGTQILITMSPALGGLINTLLDQYPGVFNIQASAALDGTVIVGVCLTVDVAAVIFARLRLGHDLDLGDFEVTPDADPPPGLNCPTSFSSTSRLPSWLAAIGNWLLPQPLSAAVLTGGGVGGSAGKLSPFGPVDPVLSATGGTGGTAGKLTPPALVLGPGGPRPNDELDCSFPVGTPVSEACRPQVTIMTAKYKAWLDGGQIGPKQGNLIPNVPVEFEVGSGGGLVGAEGACTPSASMVTINTNANGFARACWTLGPNAGEQKVWVTPDQGGLPADVTFEPATITFFATGTAGFSDGFETESGWTATGFWHRSTLTDGESPFVNSAVTDGLVNLAPGDGSAGALPSPFDGSYVFWYGQDATGSYIGTRANSIVGSGGTSTSANSGTLTSPVIVVPSDGALEFRTWFEIESVDAPYFDLMTISIEQVTPAGPTVELGNLNSDTDFNGLAATPFSSGGYNTAPAWTIVSEDISAYSGQSIRLKFGFSTGDVLYNGFRGWIIDNVQVISQPSALRASFGGKAAVGLNPPRSHQPRNP